MLQALGLSTLFHLMLLSIPVGQSWVIREQLGSSGTTKEADPAPLKVRLAPHALQPPQRVLSDQVKFPEQPSAAAFLESAGQGTGNLGIVGGATGTEIPTSTPGTTGIPALYYYAPNELTQRAKVLRDIDPFLGDLKNSPGAGKAIITLWINEQGAVDRTQIETSNLDASFEKSITAQFESAIFQPAERGGLPVKSLMKIEVEIIPRSRFTQYDAQQ